MKFTLDWLKDYLDTDATPDVIAGRLTNIGLEVDDIETEITPIVAKIVECEDIAGTHLHKLMVDFGSGTLRQVVCGAPNARVGLVSALALPGCKIGDMEIKSGKIRGILSDGMMCSERELGLGDNHDGIVELDESVEIIGQQLKSKIRNQKSEIIFDASITPNRPDYLAVRGIAHDLAASGVGKFIHKYDNYSGDLVDGTRDAIIENYTACPVYYMCEVRDIKMTSSNSKIAARLTAIGINPKNACIDATNYICHDIGQPMHCFDADQVNGNIIIRNAKPGEKFTDLFGTEHVLIDTDLVIADSDGILALAGVIGGLRGMTTDDTKNIILESAYFEPVGIRKTRRRLGLSTDASYRYERGIDPTITFHGIMQSLKIIHDACGGTAHVPFRDWDKENPKLAFKGKKTVEEVESMTILDLDPRRIKYSPILFKQKTGIDLAPETQREILDKLGFGVEIINHKSEIRNWIVIPTPARVDVQIPENIVSELIRIYGYDKIESAECRVQSSDKNNCTLNSELCTLKSNLCALGLTESISYGFGDSTKEEMLSDKPSIPVKNPIIADFNTARNSLVQNMLDIIAGNDRFKRSNLNLFEIGTVFDGNQPGQQHDQLIIARTGIAGPNIGAKHGPGVEIYDVREDLLSLFGDDAITENDSSPHKWGNPYRAGRIMKNGMMVAQFAELHPRLAKKFGIKTRVVLGLVDDISKLDTRNSKLESRVSNFEFRISTNDFPEFPLITRDFAFIVDNDVLPDDMAAFIKINNPIVFDTNVFDVFDMGNGKKSIAFELVLQPTSNMSDGDLLDFQNKVIAEIESKFDAKIRDK